jgi:hypothetical protein
LLICRRPNPPPADYTTLTTSGAGLLNRRGASFLDRRSQRWTQIIDEILARIYVMRCQLVHGAATCGGKLNRTSLKHCVTMMQRLLPALLLVWIDHGADEDWGTMCYPPVGTLPKPPSEDNGRPKNPK